MDWGDAPDPTYPTLAINNGARHANDGVTYLGIYCDSEPDAIPDISATGDDLFNAVDDEDGIIFPASLKKGRTDTLRVTVTANGILNGWFDFNIDGDWSDAGEHALMNVAVTAGLNNLLLTVPWNTTPDTTYARFRFASYSGLGYTGAASNGEVEDYRIVFLDSVPPNLSVQSVTIDSGQQVCYNATDSLIVAGPSWVIFNTNVVINNGGAAAFIAGQVVIFKQGFRAHQGSAVDAHITTNSNFCNTQSPSLVSNTALLTASVAIPEPPSRENQEILIYPNPTTGKFTIEIINDTFSGTVRIMNYLGASSGQALLKGQQSIEMDISTLPPGLYLVIIQSAVNTMTAKIVKY